ncbi:MAG: hypothetical protein KBG82_02385 [Spirochaetes bacterium]|nr:hypothetical protein [Spirochaetota bacterium]HNV43202.1 hypothetical protein [Exilispira sp.]MBP8990808.1 hypothetical protein [Spirochaetota bacterium]HOV45617.1 hypothetical protein [Exilispira sp.]HPO60013.1 hypothetical protein [Exilispira sp.]
MIDRIISTITLVLIIIILLRMVASYLVSKNMEKNKKSNIYRFAFNFKRISNFLFTGFDGKFSLALNHWNLGYLFLVLFIMILQKLISLLIQFL